MDFTIQCTIAFVRADNLLGWIGNCDIRLQTKKTNISTVMHYRSNVYSFVVMGYRGAVKMQANRQHWSVKL